MSFDIPRDDTVLTPAELLARSSPNGKPPAYTVPDDPDVAHTLSLLDRAGCQVKDEKGGWSCWCPAHGRNRVQCGITTHEMLDPNGMRRYAQLSCPEPTCTVVPKLTALGLEDFAALFYAPSGHSKVPPPEPSRKPSRKGTRPAPRTVTGSDLVLVTGTKLVFTDTDVANGRRFVADHAENVRYVADWEQWVVFDGTRWEVDRSKTRIEALAKDTVHRMALEAAGVVGTVAKEMADAVKDASEGKPDEALKKKDQQARATLKHAKASADMRNIGRMLHAARSEPEVCVASGGKLFDTRRDLLNVPNGTVELRTGKLREHRRADFITRLAPTPFNPDAPRDGYVSFLKRVFDGKHDVVKYVRDLSGYAITGEVTDQTLHIFNGEGSNGKSVLISLWTAVLGESEYVHTAPAELLLSDGRGERHPTEKTGLRGGSPGRVFGDGRRPVP